MATSSRSNRTSLLVPAVLLAVIAALALGMYLGDSGSGDQPQQPTGAESSAAEDGQSDAQQQSEELAEQLRSLERREPDDPMAMGDVDAPVVMIEWADFQCPFCGSFARDTKPELEQQYVEEGLLRIEWRDLPMLGSDSMPAAMAGRAAAEQGAFWQLHDEIFAEEREIDSGELSEDALVEMAGELGLDTEQFAADMQDEQLQAEVEADRQQARDLGITGTPAFLINGQVMIGGQPTAQFESAIEEAADQAEGS